MEKATEMDSKAWLQRLKEESWEAELLVSAIAIFGAFQLFGIVDWGTNRFIDFLHPDQYFLGYAIAYCGLLAVSMVACMFVIHFCLRSYWVGLVGLNSVFPDYSVEDSFHSKIYTEKFTALLPTLKDSINRVDELCSVIFASAFCLLLVYAYFALLLTFGLFAFNFLSNYIPASTVLIPVYLIGVLMFSNFILSMIANLKRFKDYEKLQLMYFWNTYILNLLTLGPFYKSILQITMIFGSNFKKNKSLGILVMVFFLCGMSYSLFAIGQTKLMYLIYSDFFEDTTRAYSENYKDQNQTLTFLPAPEIKSDVISQPVFKLFVPLFRYEKSLLEFEACNKQQDISDLEGQELALARQQKMKCYDAYHEVRLNGELVTNSFKRSLHARTDQAGLLTFISLDSSDIGNNTLTIKKHFNDEFSKEWHIAFYYAPSAD